MGCAGPGMMAAHPGLAFLHLADDVRRKPRGVFSSNPVLSAGATASIKVKKAFLRGGEV